MPIWSRNFARTPLILLAVVEATILFVSVYLASYMTIGGTRLADQVLDPLAPKASALAFVMLMSLIAMGLYQFHQRVYFHEVFARVVVGFFLGSLVLAVAYYAIPSIGFTPQMAAISVAVALVSLSFIRYLFIRNVDENIFRRRTVVFGAGERSKAITDLKRRADRRGFKILGHVPAPGDRIRNDATGVCRDVECLTQFALESGADEIVVAMDDRRGNLPVRALIDAKLRGVEVIDLVDFMERETGKIHLDLVKPGWLIFTPGFRLTRLRQYSKRVFDVAAAAAGLLVAWPIMLIVAIAIKVCDGVNQPVFYRQKRVGFHGQPFEVLKFRSMRTDAEKDGTARWATENDPRITKVGHVLRKYRLDELPQIFNVLAGQMSVVGPRPERPEFVKQLSEDIAYYDERHMVKPGVTGWAQLKYAYGSSTNDAKQKLQYDLYYVKNHSLLLDLMIILQTVEVILWGKGSR